MYVHGIRKSGRKNKHGISVNKTPMKINNNLIRKVFRKLTGNNQAFTFTGTCICKFNISRVYLNRERRARNNKKTNFHFEVPTFHCCEMSRMSALGSYSHGVAH